MEFLFKTGNYDVPGLTKQVSRALEVRTELESRAKMPRMWKAIDRMNEDQVSDEVKERRAKRSKIYGVLLLILGVLLLVPGLMDPGEMALQLFAGCVGIVAGALTLIPRKARRSNLQRRIERSARDLLAQLKAAPQTEVRFTDESMQLGDDATIPYQKFTCVVETEDVYLFVWGKEATVLRKCDLCECEAEDFDAFLREKTTVTDAAAAQQA